MGKKDSVFIRVLWLMFAAAISRGTLYQRYFTVLCFVNNYRTNGRVCEMA